jgi:DNA topoisomerase I
MPMRPSGPTTLAYSPEAIKEYLNKDQQKLYGIIWERFLASQMTPAKQRSLAIDAAAGRPSSGSTHPGWSRKASTR